MVYWGNTTCTEGMRTQCQMYWGGAPFYVTSLSASGGIDAASGALTHLTGGSMVIALEGHGIS